MTAAAAQGRAREGDWKRIDLGAEGIVAAGRRREHDGRGTVHGEHRRRAHGHSCFSSSFFFMRFRSASNPSLLMILLNSAR